jgi:translation elongation factor EF-1alpha
MRVQHTFLAGCILAEHATILQVRGQRHPVAMAGDSVDVGLAGVDDGDLEPGSTLCDPEYPVRVATVLQVPPQTAV